MYLSYPHWTIICERWELHQIFWWLVMELTIRYKQCLLPFLDGYKCPGSNWPRSIIPVPEKETKQGWGCIPSVHKVSYEACQQKKWHWQQIETMELHILIQRWNNWTQTLSSTIRVKLVLLEGFSVKVKAVITRCTRMQSLCYRSYFHVPLKMGSSVSRRRPAELIITHYLNAESPVQEANGALAACRAATISPL